MRETHSDWVISGREGPLREHRDRGDLGRLWLWAAREDQGLGVSAVSNPVVFVSKKGGGEFRIYILGQLASVNVSYFVVYM